MSFDRDIVIRARDLSKAYRLFIQPQDRLKYSLFRRFGKEYGSAFWAARGISFELGKGEMLGVIGRNGSGKSTLLQMLAGILEPTEGELTRIGRVAALLELGSGFNPEFTGRENIYLNASIIGLSPKETEEKIKDIIDFADIGSFLEQPVKLYSSGMFVRLAFAVTTGLDADILLVDEALAVGDVFFRQKCYQRLQDMLKNGTSVILVTHNMSDVEQFCTQAMLLDKGRMIFHGSVTETVRQFYLLNQPTQDVALASSPPALSVMNSDVASPINEGNSSEDWIWPQENVFFEISKEKELIAHKVSCTKLAICNGDGFSQSVFSQGEWMHVYYEFLIDDDITYPINGILIRNQHNILISGKNSLQSHRDIIPSFIPQGSVLQCHQAIMVNVGLGEYTLDISLNMLSMRDFENVDIISETLGQHFVRLSFVEKVASIRVNRRGQGARGILTHYGICNLPDDLDVHIITP